MPLGLMMPSTAARATDGQGRPCPKTFPNKRVCLRTRYQSHGKIIQYRYKSIGTKGQKCKYKSIGTKVQVKTNNLNL